MQTGAEKWVWRVLFGLGALFAIGSVIGFSWFTINDYRARSWPSVTGQVIQSTIESSRSSRRRTHYPKITYRYEVGGRQFENNHIWLNDSKGFRDRENARQITRAYPLNAPAQIFYDPDDPSRSRLVASDPPWYFLLTLAAGLFLMLFRRLFAGRVKRRQA